MMRRQVSVSITTYYNFVMGRAYGYDLTDFATAVRCRGSGRGTCVAGLSGRIWFLAFFLSSLCWYGRVVSPLSLERRDLRLYLPRRGCMYKRNPNREKLRRRLKPTPLFPAVSGAVSSISSHVGPLESIE